MRRIRDVILEGEHVSELVQMANEDLLGSFEFTGDEIENVKKQVAQILYRLERHYDDWRRSHSIFTILRLGSMNCERILMPQRRGSRI